MPTVPLPGELSFEQLRKQAKDLQRAVRAEDPAALAELAERYPDRPIPGQAPAAPRGLRRPAALSLSAAQLVVARRYGFASWTRLKRHAETVERLSRYPARMDAEAGGTLSPDTVSPGSAGSGTVSVGTIGAGRDLASLTDAFLRLACLTYEDDQPERWQQARRLLAAHPEISQHSVYPAAACADTGALRAILGADPAAARREGGPYRWEPLLYLAYARHDPAVPQDAVLGAARLLLAAGADPNAGYLWHGFTSPFTALTGVLGEGELGPVRQPPHPHWQALARLLLAAGAEPNDPQGLYNRMFEPGAEHLALLFELGLGAGDGGPWRRLLGNEIDPPASQVRGQLAWAITHGMADRVRLIVEHGADLTVPLDGASAAALAATTGHAELVDYLVAHGAPALELDPAGEFAAAVLAADASRVDELVSRYPGLAGEVRTARPALLVWAATRGDPRPVELLARLGFDVNAKGRTDTPSDTPWQTALHKAAEDGNAELARTLLALGADPGIRDARFGSTPLSWARHFGQEELIELLAPVTTPEPAHDEEGAGEAGGG